LVNGLILACIPAYNEEKVIKRVVLQCMKYVDKVAICDDGSQDATAAVAERLGVIVRQNEKNIGKGAALSALFRVARELQSDVTITLDADGQHDPREIPKLIKPILNSSADVVIGSRYIKEVNVPLLRRFGSQILNILVNLFSKGRISDTQSGYRAYSKKALEALEVTEKGMGVDSQLLIDALRNGLNIVEVHIAGIYEGDTSTYNPVRHGLTVLLSTVKVTVMRSMKARPVAISI